MNLIFLPGASGCTELWQPVMAQLPKNDTQSVLAYPSFGGYADHAQITSFDDLQAYVLDQIQQPSVLIAQSMGADDLISPVAVGQYLQKKIQQSHLSIVENAQHDVAKVHAEQVGGLIHDFLTSACR